VALRASGVGQPSEQPVEGGLAVIDGGALVVGERIATSIRCRLASASRSCALDEFFGM
jgi:hypothetical protein